MSEFSKLVIIAVTAIGLVSVVGGLIIGGIAIWRLTHREYTPPDAAARALPVEDADKVQQADNVIVRQEWRQTG